jgi:uracil-DNA glycosylase
MPVAGRKRIAQARPVSRIRAPAMQPGKRVEIIPVTPAGALARVAREARRCRACVDELPLGPRPVFQVGSTARLFIVGQAPGRRVHETGIPWNDASGDRLRSWMGIDREFFYDATRIAIVPTGLCYPGTGPRGDAPPMPACAPLWQPRFRAALPEIRLTLLIGQYAQAYYLGGRRGSSVSATVRAWKKFLPDFLPLPHPSPRNQLWLKRNPWFEREVVPALRQALAQVFFQRATTAK